MLRTLAILSVIIFLAGLVYGGLFVADHFMHRKARAQQQKAIEKLLKSTDDNIKRANEVLNGLKKPSNDNGEDLIKKAQEALEMIDD